MWNISRSKIDPRKPHNSIECSVSYCYNLFYMLPWALFWSMIVKTLRNFLVNFHYCIIITIFLSVIRRFTRTKIPRRCRHCAGLLIWLSALSRCSINDEVSYKKFSLIYSLCNFILNLDELILLLLLLKPSNI